MDERAADAEVVSIDDLLERVRREGPVLRFNNDVVGILIRPWRSGSTRPTPTSTPYRIH
jgi:hypothetical protein